MAAETAAQRKLSVGKKVTVNGRGYLGQGKVIEVRQTPGNGEYVHVRFGDKKTSLIDKQFRPSQLTRWN